jgi:hypothetical protein
MSAMRALRSSTVPPGGRSGRVSIVPAAAIDDKRMTASALRVLAALGTYADPEGWCWPRQQVVADRIGVTRQAVSRALRALAAWGYAEIHEQHDPKTGARTASRYRVRFDYELPPELRRTPQPDVAGGGNLTLIPPQPDVAAPRNVGVTGHVNPSVTSPATQLVAATKEERPKRTTQKNVPPSGVGAARAATAAFGEGAETSEAEEAPPKRARRGQRERVGEATPPPDTIELTDVSYATALKWGFDRAAVDFQLERFLNTARRDGRTYVDWKAGFRTWLLNQVEYAKRDGRPTGRPSQASSDDRLPSRAARMKSQVFNHDA